MIAVFAPRPPVYFLLGSPRLSRPNPHAIIHGVNFLVTGGAGFLGTALANRLAREGHQVRVLDDLSAGDAARLDHAVLFTRGDVNDRPKLWTLLQDVECVYHLAARVSVPESILYPREYNAVNVGGTVSVMEAMRDVGVQRVILASSGAVYGEQAQHTLTEDVVPNPGSPYAVSKLAAEFYVHTIGRLWGIETVALRIFNAYGPGQPLPVAHPPVIPHFLRLARQKGTLVVNGSGEQTRDFVYIDDVVDALVAAATARSTDIDQQIINVGSGVATRIRDLVTHVGTALGVSPHVIYKDNSNPGVTRMQTDISKARRLLNFRPRVPLADGLQHMVTQDDRFR